jgi:transcription elongation factor GreB
VSKAFTDEEAQEQPPLVRPRAPLPSGMPNYVTARGLAELRAELVELDAQRAALARADAAALAALAQRRAELEQRLASAELVPPPPDPDAVRFGARVAVHGADGERRYQIVGVDEADAARGKIAFVAPLARVLIGCSVGERVRLRVPRGDEELCILSIEYDD